MQHETISPRCQHSRADDGAGLLWRRGALPPTHPLNIERIARSEGLSIDKKKKVRTLDGKIERALDRLREPKWRWLRIPAGVLFVFGGIVGFLPLVGFWMLPLGLALLAPDVPLAGRALKKLDNFWNWLRRS